MKYRIRLELSGESARRDEMKNLVVCLLLCLSFFVFFACATQPSAPEPVPEPTPAPAPKPTPAPPPEPPKAAAPSRATDLILDGAETYTVVRGDTLTKISRRKYQNGFYWPLIMMASPSAWTTFNMDQDQDLIEPGMALTIPNLQANLNDARAKESMKKFFLETAGITERIRPKDAAGLQKLANSWQ